MASDRAPRSTAATVIRSAYLLLAIAFVLSSTWQLTQSAFAHPKAEEMPPDCKGGVATLYAGFIAARRASSEEPSADRARARFAESLAVAWKDREAVERACGGSEAGRSAYLGLLRLRHLAQSDYRSEGWRVTSMMRELEASGLLNPRP